MKAFCVFRKNGVWYCRLKLSYDNGKQVIFKFSSKDYRRIIRYAWMVKIEKDISLLESLILV
ncbi:MAG: hypothetical protein E7311_05985 [Clostridiales bacterium]|nr:hypothetical protein [Clostridiales bacterium]